LWAAFGGLYGLRRCGYLRGARDILIVRVEIGDNDEVFLHRLVVYVRVGAPTPDGLAGR